MSSDHKKPFFACFLLLALVLGVFSSSRVLAGTPRMGGLIQKVALQENVDPQLLSIIVALESDFDVYSTSAKGARGLMQLMPETARDLGIADVFDPEENLRGGARYLKRLMQRFPNLGLALAAYNAGPENIVKFKGIPPFEETQRYVESILVSYSKSVPGTMQAPKRASKFPKFGKFPKFRGSLVLSDSRRILNLEVDSDDSVRLLKRSPFLSIRKYSEGEKISRSFVREVD